MEDAGPENAAVTQWKWATTVFPNDLNAVDVDYTIQVVDTCPPMPNSSGFEVVSQDLSFDLRKRIQLTQTQICPPGRPTCRCLEMRLQVYGAPTSGTMFYSADYYHSGSSAEH